MRLSQSHYLANLKNALGDDDGGRFTKPQCIYLFDRG